jgi:hypothetical protein
MSLDTKTSFYATRSTFNLGRKKVQMSIVLVIRNDSVGNKRGKLKICMSHVSGLARANNG